MRALRKLLDAGHSLVVIEHNLDVIRASDWLIDLGPEGGEAGGQVVVCTGTPEEVKLHPTSHTGKALRRLRRPSLGGDTGPLLLRVEEGVPLQAVVKRIARDAACPRGDIHPHRQRPRAQPEVAQTWTSRAASSAWSPASVRFGQEHAGLRHPVQRGPAALPGIAERLRPQHRAAGRAARGGCGVRHPAHGGDRAAPEPRRPQEHGGRPPPRSGTSCACCT